MDPSIIITTDDDGNEHYHHVLIFSKADKNTRTIAEYAAQLRSSKKAEDNVLASSSYFKEISAMQHRSDAALGDHSSSKSSSSRGGVSGSSTAAGTIKHKHVRRRTNVKTQHTLLVSALTDIETTVDSYTASVRARGSYTVGANALLANMSSNKNLRASMHSPVQMKGTVHSPQKEYFIPVNPNESYKATENIFTQAQEAKINSQGKSVKIKAKMRYQTALLKMKSKSNMFVRKDAIEDINNSEANHIALRPAIPSSSISRSSPRRISVQKKEKRLHENICMSDATRRKVRCGQTMKSVETEMKTSNKLRDFPTKCAIAQDMQLEKQVWKTNKRDRGRKGGRRPSFAATTKTKDGPSSASSGGGISVSVAGQSPRRRGRQHRGGSFLMLADPSVGKNGLASRHQTINRGLPENKQHWHTVKAGPCARAAALQTERLQRITEDEAKKEALGGITTNDKAKKEEQEQKIRWKELIGGLRTTNQRVASNNEYRNHIMQNISRSGKHLKTWQDGFRNLHKTHQLRLQNALTVRELHRVEMETNDHIGYILKRVELKAKSKAKNGSETLKKSQRQSQSQNKSLRTLSSAADLHRTNTNTDENDENGEKDLWAPEHDRVPEVITKGTLTSLWTEARIERRTKEEVKSLGDNVVKFWHHFCLERANLPGNPAPGENMLVLRLKTLLEDGDSITEQVVHDMLMMADKSGNGKHPRLKKLLSCLRTQAKAN